ncbi:MAG: hypothetical protein ABSH16_04680 [Sedimentisphaerales bacterium]
MKKFCMIAILVFLVLFLQGCMQMILESALGGEMGDGIALNPNPILSEESPLSSISPRRISVITFKGLSRLEHTGLSSFVIMNIPNIPQFLSQALANEFKRNNHSIVGENEPCDFFAQGIVKEFSIEHIPFTSKVKALIVVDLSLYKGQDRSVLFTKTCTGTVTKAGYADSDIRTRDYYIIGALNEAILDWLHNISQDPKLSDALKSEKN